MRAADPHGTLAGFAVTARGPRRPWLVAIYGQAAPRDQAILLAPPQPLDRRLPFQGGRPAGLGLNVDDLHWEPAAGVPRRLAGGMGLQPLRHIIGDAAVQRAIAAAEEVHDPATIGTMVPCCDCAARCVARRCHRGCLPLPRFTRHHACRAAYSTARPGRAPAQRPGRRGGPVAA